MSYDLPDQRRGMPTRYITLCVAEYCNLNCTYCYEHHKTSKRMSRETALQILERELAHVCPCEYVCIEFFGGEPFLGFDTIKCACEYVASVLKPEQYIAFATTNGVLVHGEIKEWLLAHPEFSCSLSLDGTREMHNINRSGSFDQIDLDFFAKQYPEQSIKMTVSRETLPHMAEGVIFCQEKGFTVSVNLAFGPDWSDSETVDILTEQLSLLIDYYLAHPDIKPCSMLDFDITPIAYLKNTDHARKWCGASTSMHTYDADGVCYPCQYFMPITLGRERADALKDTKLPEYISLDHYPERCRSCCLLNICPMCYGSNYASTGDFFTVSEDMCLMTKVIMKARAYFRALQIDTGQLSALSEEEMAYLCQAIMMIQNVE